VLRISKAECERQMDALKPKPPKVDSAAKQPTPGDMFKKRAHPMKFWKYPLPLWPFPWLNGTKPMPMAPLRRLLLPAQWHLFVCARRKVDHSSRRIPCSRSTLSLRPAAPVLRSVLVLLFVAFVLCRILLSFARLQW
jgi:hypothetical protein